jgi:WD40 repeat protein
VAGFAASSPDIRALVITSDGTRLIMGAEDGSIRLLATYPVKRLYSARAHVGGVLALAIFEEKQDIYVFSAGVDGRVRRWRVTADRLLDPVDLPNIAADGRLRALAVTATSVAAGGQEGLLRVSDHDGGNVVVRPTGMDVLTVSFSPNGRNIVAGGTRNMSGVAQLWGLSDKRKTPLDEITVTNCSAVRSVLMVDQKKAILGGDNGSIMEWGAGAVEFFESGHTGPVHALVRASQNTMVSASSDGRVLKWNLTTRTRIQDLGLNSASGVFALAIPENADRPTIYAAGGNGELRGIRDGKPILPPFDGHTRAVRAIAVDQRNLVVTGSADGTARLWTMTGEPDGILSGHRGAVSAVATWPNDNARIVTGGEDGHIILWDRFNQLPDGLPLVHGAKVWALAVSPDGKHVLSGGNDRKVRMWNATTRAQIGEPWAGPRKAVSAIAISGNGAHAVVGEDDGNIAFLDLARRDQPSNYEKAVAGGQVRSVAIDFAGETAVVGGQDGRITIWNVRTRKQIGEPIPTGHRDVKKVLLSNDGDTIISCGANGSIERWNRHTRQLVGVVHSDFAGAVEAIALMPDGELIIAGGSEGELDLVRTAEPRVGNGLLPTSGPNGSVSDIDPPHPNPTSDEPTPFDTIDNTAEVRAIAELIAARHTRPPLSLALLGDWGSGKSSLILQIEKRVHDLAETAKRDPSAQSWAGSVRQIRFNAWHYSDTQLWTLLMEQLLHGLRQDPDLVDPAEPAAGSPDHDQELAAKEKAVQHDLEVAKAAKTSLRHPFAVVRRVRYTKRAMGKLAALQLAEHQEQVSQMLDEAKAVDRRRGRALWVLAAAVAIGVPLAIVGREWIAHAYDWLWSAGVAVAGLAAPLKPLRTWFTKLDDLTKKATQMVDEVAVERGRDAGDSTYQFNKVLDNLIKSNNYRRLRGSVGFAYHDLRRLIDALRRANRKCEPGTSVVERIVLYIDDLDRCPPDRVAEVIQAVNLLMSMQIFIVVVAVNPQWLFQSLEQAHATDVPGDRRERHQRALGLLDKVFNLVYTMRPLGERRATYLMSLIDDMEREQLPVAAVPTTNGAHPGQQAPGWSPSGPGRPLARLGIGFAPPQASAWDLPNRTLRISQPEIDLLLSLSTLLRGPRAVKKLMNIYRLVLMDQHDRRPEYLEQDYQAAAIMAAGLVHCPEEFSALIDHLSTARCDDHPNRHEDIVEFLTRPNPARNSVSALLGRYIAEHTSAAPSLRCPIRYREWSIRVARYSFETYHQYRAC